MQIGSSRSFSFECRSSIRQQFSKFDKMCLSGSKPSENLTGFGSLLQHGRLHGTPMVGLTTDLVASWVNSNKC